MYFNIDKIPFEIDRDNKVITLQGNPVNCYYKAIEDIIDNPESFERRCMTLYGNIDYSDNAKEFIVFYNNSNEIKIFIDDFVYGDSLIDSKGNITKVKDEIFIPINSEINRDYKFVQTYDPLIIINNSIIELFDENTLQIKRDKYKCPISTLKSFLPNPGKDWGEKHDKKVRDIIYNDLKGVNAEDAKYIRKNIKTSNYSIELIKIGRYILPLVRIDDKSIVYDTDYIETGYTKDDYSLITDNLKVAKLVIPPGCEYSVKRGKTSGIEIDEYKYKTIIEVTDEEVIINGKRANEQIERGIRLLLK